MFKGEEYRRGGNKNCVRKILSVSLRASLMCVYFAFKLSLKEGVGNSGFEVVACINKQEIHKP